MLRLCLLASQLTSATYKPQPSSPWAGSVDFQADWLGQAGRGWDMIKASQPSGLGLLCRDPKTRKPIGEWFYTVPGWRQPTATPTATPTPKAGSMYTIGGKRYTLCNCNDGAGCNKPVGGGFGVQMEGSSSCVNCAPPAYPCPSNMQCRKGKGSANQDATDTFSVCA